MEGTRDRQSLLKRAFFNQYNFILLAGAAAFAAALSSPWPLAVAAAGEILWLLLGPGSSTFQRWAARQASQEAQLLSAGARASAASALEPHYAARLRALEGLAAEIRTLVNERGLDAGPLDREGRGLDAMLLVFVKIASLHQYLDRFAATGNALHIEQDLLRMGQQMADEKDPSVRLTLRQALALGQRRLKQHEQIDSQRRALGVKLSTLEMSFDYLRSHVFAGSSAEELTLALDELAAGASFLPSAEAEVQAAIAKLQSPVVTRTVTGTALAGGS